MTLGVGEKVCGVGQKGGITEQQSGTSHIMLQSATSDLILARPHTPEGISPTSEFP